MSKFVAVEITRGRAKIWKNGLEPHIGPKIIFHPEQIPTHKLKLNQFQRMHELDNRRPEYLEEVSQELRDAGEIILFSHGKGKANYALHLAKYLKSKHPNIYNKVIDTLRVDLDNLTDDQILELARIKRKAYINKA